MKPSARPAAPPHSQVPVRLLPQPLGAPVATGCEVLKPVLKVLVLQKVELQGRGDCCLVCGGVLQGWGRGGSRTAGTWPPQDELGSAAWGQRALGVQGAGVQPWLCVSPGLSFHVGSRGWGGAPLAHGELVTEHPVPR